MHIYVDESGTFTATQAAPPDSWCVIAAYTSPEQDEEKLDRIVRQLRDDCGNGAEVKLHQISEARYIRFLRDISNLMGLAFAVAADVSLHSEAAIRDHRDGQALKIIEHRDKLLHAAAREGITALSEAIRSLPLQLYTQLQCQVALFHKVLTRAPLYYSQHKPDTLGRLSWRVDQKDTIPTAYEDAFQRILAALLQSISMHEPMIMLKEGNYEAFKRFEFPPGEYPTYLEDDYGIQTGGNGMNVGQMVREDFRFVDSNAVPGVQVADLLASGLRRLFRGGFKRSHEIALLLGANMVGELGGEPQVRLLSLSHEATVSEKTAYLLELLRRKAKPIVR